MSTNKRHSGLALLDATRLALSNHSPTEPSISVNGRALSYRDVDLGALKLTDGKAFTLDESDGNHYELLHTNSNFTISLEEEDDEGTPTGSKVSQGQIIPSGDNLFKQASPAPFAYIDTTGRLGSANLWHNLFVANVMGYVDVDKDTSTYRHGLCPEGSADHGGLFLRKDGQWGSPSLYTGSVSETFLSLNDTPTTYTSMQDRYVRVSYAEGGSLVFDAIDTDKVPEATRMYYTEPRVDDRIQTKLQDKSLANISVTGTITCNEVVSESDRRLKTRIADVNPELALEVVDQIRPRRYVFKREPTRERYGVVAQELQAVAPQFVHTCDDGTLGVNYVELVPLLIASVQRLKGEVERLRSVV